MFSLSAETKPAEIVNAVVENKIVGEGLLERKSQYHSQNELGEATYGHRDQFQSHDAVQDAAGNKAGSFSYIAPDGRLLTTEYVADQNGYRVASNALPRVEKLVPVELEKPFESSSSEEVVVEVTLLSIAYTFFVKTKCQNLKKKTLIFRPNHVTVAQWHHLWLHPL